MVWLMHSVESSLHDGVTSHACVNTPRAERDSCQRLQDLTSNAHITCSQFLYCPSILPEHNGEM